MKMNECTVDTAHFPETVEEFNELQKTKGFALHAVAKVAEKILKLLGAEERFFHGFKYYAIGLCWGGLEFGDFFVCGRSSAEITKKHELGHAIQNANVGGWTMLIHWIGSGLRYWYYQIFNPKKDYDAWYYEGNATALGKKYVEILEAKNETADKN